MEITKKRMGQLLYNTLSVLEEYESENTKHWVCEETGMTEKEYEYIHTTEFQLKVFTKLIG